MIDAGASIRAQLAPDEQLVWSGRPRTGVRFRPADALMMPLSLMWGGFALFWEWTVVSRDAPLLFKMWGVPFVLMGLYLIVGRFFWDSYRRGRTAYGLTDQRVIIVTNTPGTRVKSLQLRTMTDVTLTESGDRSGSIQFGPGLSWPGAWWAGTGWPGTSRAVPAFEMLEDARSIYDLVRRASLGPSSAPSGGNARVP